MEVNLTGVFYVAQEAARRMPAGDGGEIAGGLAGPTWRFDPLSERRTVNAEFLLPPEGHTVLAFGASVGTM